MRVLTFVVAGLIHAVTVGLPVLAMGFFVLGWPNVLALLGGCLCLSIAWIIRPRFARLQGRQLPRTEFPALFTLLDTVAAFLHASPIKIVVVDGEFNAAVGSVGWKRQRVLRLGLPLMAILDDQERVALVAHEFAHTVNGDLGRGFVVGTAVETLCTWSVLVRPEYVWPPDTGLEGILAIPFTLAMYGLSYCVWGAAYVLVHLLWQDRQRAEYLADHLAASASGSEAMRTLLAKIHLAPTLGMSLHGLTRQQDAPIDLVEDFRARLARVPTRELERVKRVMQLDGSRLDATHPPTVYRMQFMDAKRVAQPGVTLLASVSVSLERELMSLKTTVQRDLTEAVRGALYE